jgi:predicted amidohydrolase YtcJ
MTTKPAPRPDQATLLLHGGTVIACDGGGTGTGTVAQAVAIHGNRILAIGRAEDMAALATPATQRVDLAGRTVIPGMTDGHAHLDREGLRRHLPSLQGARCIDDILDRIAHEVRRTPPGTWIVTQPIGEPPEYPDPAAGLREGRYPTRHDLDRVSPDHPVYIRPIWGYWRNRAPLVSIANTLALRLAGIDRHTVPPSPDITLGRDASGEPDGTFSESTLVPIVEHSLMRVAPGFSAAQRASGLRSAMHAYNAVGTTAVFEGHGVAGEVIAAYRDVANQGAATVRATLTFSPRWGIEASAGSEAGAASGPGKAGNGHAGRSGADTAIELLRDWRSWLRRRHADHPWVRLQGLYAEIDADPLNNTLRASNHPCTGWAGFQAGAALPEAVLQPLLIEAARESIRVCGIWPTLLPLFQVAHRVHPINDLRWVLGHQPVLTQDMIETVHDLGLVITTHTNRHIYKDGDVWVDKRRAMSSIDDGAGIRHPDNPVNDIVPLRRLLDAGVPVAFGSDNLPVSLFGPISHAVLRQSRNGNPVAPDQAISRAEALTIATMGGAWLTHDESTRGSITPGKLADLVILNDNPLTCAPEALAGLRADHLIIDGRLHAADPPQEFSHD